MEHENTKKESHTMSLKDTENSAISVVELPKSNRKVAVEDKEPVALTGRADTEDQAHKELKRMFIAACKGVARASVTMREAIDACLEAGITEDKLAEWALEAGYKLKTFQNTMVQVRKESGEMVKIVKSYDQRRKAQKDPVKKSRAEKYYGLMVREFGSAKIVQSVALAVARMAKEAIEGDGKE